MFKIIAKLLLALIFWGIFTLAVLQIPYPDSFTQASFTQLSLFFIPLYLALAFTINIPIRRILISLLISSSLIILLILKALNDLNITTSLLTIAATVLLVSYLKRAKRHKGSRPSKTLRLRSL